MKQSVTYARCVDYTPEHLEPAMRAILEEQILAFGGVRGKKILLKPNWLAWRREDDIACVHPAIVVTAAKLFLEAGAAKVAVMENPAVQSAESIARAMNIDTVLKEMGVPVATFQNYQTTKVPEKTIFRNLEIAEEFLDYDAVVNLAKAKTHAMMILTLCVKNLFGLVRGAERLGWHLTVGKDFRKFADMLLDLYLTVHPAFNILDGIVCMEGNGPGSGMPTARNFLAGGTDALAVDASVSKYLGVPQLLLLTCAKERNLIPEYEERGEIPEINPLKRPDPPGVLTEWGVGLPPFLKPILRELAVARPVLNPAECIGCGLCVKMCPPKSLKMKNGKPVFDLPNCIRCFCCQEHCPKGAIVPRKSFFMKLAEKFERFVRNRFPSSR